MTSSASHVSPAFARAFLAAGELCLCTTWCAGPSPPVDGPAPDGSPAAGEGRPHVHDDRGGPCRTHPQPGPHPGPPRLRPCAGAARARSGAAPPARRCAAWCWPRGATTSSSAGWGGATDPSGHVALEVLELLGHLVSYRTGRLDPSLRYLMGQAPALQGRRGARAGGAARARLPRLAAALRAHGPGGQGPAGPPGQQRLPPERARPGAAAPRPARAGAARCPTTCATPRTLRTAERAAHKASLPLDELPLLEVEDDRLGQLLASLGRAVQERESARRSESQAQKNA